MLYKGNFCGLRQIWVITKKPLTMINHVTAPTQLEITEKIEFYLKELCENIPGGHRHVGSPGNRAATDFFAGTIASFGFETEYPEFACINRAHGNAQLQAGAERFEAHVSPYSLGFSGDAPLAMASTLMEE